MVSVSLGPVVVKKGVGSLRRSDAFHEECPNIRLVSRVKLPLLWPIVVVSEATFTDKFNAFDLVFAMPGPNRRPSFSSGVLGRYFYRVGIAAQHPVGVPDMGLVAAVASIMFMVLFFGVMGTRALFRSREDVDPRGNTLSLTRVRHARIETRSCANKSRIFTVRVEKAP
ncbi:MAG: hypothetical protein ACLFM0_05485 [Spirochaetales bacterium]